MIGVAQLRDLDLRFLELALPAADSLHLLLDALLRSLGSDSLRWLLILAFPDARVALQRLVLSFVDGRRSLYDAAMRAWLL